MDRAGRPHQISIIDLSRDLSSATITGVVTSPLLHFPSTAALHGGRLAVVNAKFDTGFPPTADEYEVVIVRG